ncbi:MAG TPA: hypothetical protein VG753_02350 [Candidatus Paceibacterota bacterium]|nr:hypothetical protein [Candidatus Paceibacterota bacterium]
MRMKALLIGSAAAFAVAAFAPAYAYSPPIAGDGHVLVVDQGHQWNAYLGNINVASNDHLGVIDPLIGAGHVLAINDVNGFDYVDKQIGHAPPLIAFAIDNWRDDNNRTSGAGHGVLIPTWTAARIDGGTLLLTPAIADNGAGASDNLMITEHAVSATT